MARLTTSATSCSALSQTIDAPAVHAYFGHMGQVPGWFAPLDFLTLVGIDRFQETSGVTGDILEIGAYAGKSAILLGFFLRGAERLVVCDIFDGSASPDVDQLENLKWYGGGASRSIFETWYQTFHRELPRIIERPSTELTDVDFERPLRLIHIDGSHVYDTVRRDIAFARARSGPGAIVVLDDFGRPHAPGVAAAAWEAVLNYGLRPLFLTEGKLYAGWNTHTALVEYVASWATNLGWAAEPYSIPNGELLFLHQDQARPGLPKRMASLIVPPVIPFLGRRASRVLAHRRVVGLRSRTLHDG